MTLLEAQDRVGGRVQTAHPSSSQAADLGAWGFSGAGVGSSSGSSSSTELDPLGVLVGYALHACIPPAGAPHNTCAHSVGPNLLSPPDEWFLNPGLKVGRSGIKM